MLKLEPRAQPSRAWTYGSPLLALAITVLMGVALFMALGKDPVRGLQMFFWEPVRSPYALGELVVKATPLLLIALGLAVCFRSNIWNIGAEGQFVMGAIFAGGVALLIAAYRGGTLGTHGAVSPWAACSAAPRTDSLEKKPLNGGIAASASRARVTLTKAIGHQPSSGNAASSPTPAKAEVTMAHPSGSAGRAGCAGWLMSSAGGLVVVMVMLTASGCWPARHWVVPQTWHCSKRPVVGRRGCR